MTTVVYRDGVLAADRALTDRGCFCGEVDKIHRVGTDLVACAGPLGSIQRFLVWLRTGADDSGKPRVGDDFEALVVHPGGEVDWYGTEAIPTRLHGPWFAIGSGFRIATGALAMGATAQRAVEICCDLDDSTRGPVDTAMIDPA